MSPKIQVHDEKGSILLMALMVFLVLTVMGTVAMNMASIEYKISNYIYEEQQARQTADAGVDWAVEKVYTDCLQSLSDNSEPSFPSGISWSSPSGNGLKAVEWSVEFPVNSAQILTTSTGYSCQFISTGRFAGVSQSIEVTVIYAYNDYFLNNIFQSREYARGHIDSYKLSDNFH